MDLEYRPQNRSGRYVGIGFVVLLHILIGWALVSGLARKAVDIIKKPIEMSILEEVKPPPPPPPPPPPKEMKVTDKPPPVEAPPPPYVPPPEVQPPVQQTAPVIQAVQTTVPDRPAEIKPPPPPAPPAPVAAPKTDIGVVCPGHKAALQDALSGIYEKVGVEGIVTVSIKLHGSDIVEVRPISGPREYFRDVSRAVRRLDCKAPGGVDTVATLEISFKER